MLCPRQLSNKRHMSSFECPITHNIMTDPVVARDGYTYQRESITEWLKTNTTSPMTREVIEKTLVTNHSMRSQLGEAGYPVKSLVDVLGGNNLKQDINTTIAQMVMSDNIDFVGIVKSMIDSMLVSTPDDKSVILAKNMMDIVSSGEMTREKENELINLMISSLKM